MKSLPSILASLHKSRTTVVVVQEYTNAASAVHNVIQFSCSIRRCEHRSTDVVDIAVVQDGRQV